MENLNKALPESNLLVPLTSDDFQTMLSAWFEEKGLMSELRSQVRFKMINVLKNTVLGRDISKKSSTTVSLSKQVINSIVAEHLMQNKYQYTMSIFNTEASLTNIFPNYSNVFNSAVTDESEKESFNYENVLNVLELAGISKGGQVCKEILQVYDAERHNKSLLECLISCLSNITARTCLESDKDMLRSIDFTKEPMLVKQLATFLIDYDFTIHSFKKILSSVKEIFLSDLNNVQKQFHSEIDSCRKKVHLQECKIKTMRKEKKITENKLLGIYKDYNVLKTYTNKLLVEKNSLQEQKENIPAHQKSDDNRLNICDLTHCSETCRNNISRIELLTTENYELKSQNIRQKDEINNLTKKYNDLLRSLSDCQSKINLLNSRLNEENTSVLFNNLIIKESLEIPQVKLHKRIETSDSSDSITEAVLRETRLRLKTLEEESKEVEGKCFSFLDK